MNKMKWKIESLSKETGDKKEPNANFTTEKYNKGHLKPMLYIGIFSTAVWRGQKSQLTQRWNNINYPIQKTNENRCRKKPETHKPVGQKQT